ncbi:hypothetical protein AX15_002730 [Amanita polypyramis BW_CC]|nr:hypothetical protein AX15_002730 [Amanita polypyramis BW_CC]
MHSFLHPLSTVIWVVTLGTLACASLIPSLSHDFSILEVCDEIATSISNESEVFYPLSETYYKDIYHWASSSTQESVCTVEPGTAEDLGKILQILGQNRTSFAIKSGGHAGNPGFSSSGDISIALYRFDGVTYDPNSNTATIGTGLVFDEVYALLEPYNVTVLGARATGIGVGGFVLGGGYSWKTNQYGLAIDTVTAFELVKPNGEVVNVTEASDKQLFFGLKGGFNNFGVVTRLTMKTYPQSAVWGGAITYLPAQIPAATEAVIKFSASTTHPKANIIAAYNCILKIPGITLLLYYDEPNPPSEVFADFLNIPSFTRDVHERSLYDLIRSTLSNTTTGLRGTFTTVPLLNYSTNVVKAIQDQLNTTCQSLDGPLFLSHSVEPFLPDILSHNNVPTAYPPTRNKSYLPLFLYYAWIDKSRDGSISDGIKESAERIRDAAIADGQDIASAPLYPNYAISGTPLTEMYGDNVDELMQLKQRIDPANVMGLTGGFRF